MREEVFWWLGLAKKDLERAIRARDDKDKVSMVFWSQQSVEKALKALALAVRRDIPKTHNIRRLREFIGETLGLPEEVWEKAYELTQYYYVSRYPDIVEGIPDEVISLDTANEAVDIAEKVVKAVERRIRDGE
ncbi:MAG: DNA-binding protein [Desulfurococcales archaeon ex4484_217_2]|nr:MAG: DNA-binding protein [Desulfurococcales archaeon ex4484_217_2]